MKDWKSIKVEKKTMKDIESIIEGSNESRIGFATAAIEKEIERIKKERAELDIQELADEFRNNAVLYSKKGIKSLHDYASQLKTNTKEIKRLEARIDDYEQTTREMIATFDQDQLKILTHKEMKQMLKEIGEEEDKNIAKTKRLRKSK